MDNVILSKLSLHRVAPFYVPPSMNRNSKVLEMFSVTQEWNHSLPDLIPGSLIGTSSESVPGLAVVASPPVSAIGELWQLSFMKFHTVLLIPQILENLTGVVMIASTWLGQSEQSSMDFFHRGFWSISTQKAACPKFVFCLVRKDSSSTACLGHRHLIHTWKIVII